MANRTLLLVRHAQTIWHDSGGIAGRTDIALSEYGQQSVPQLVHGWPPNLTVERWFSSPMQRTTETTELLRAGLSQREWSVQRSRGQLELPAVELDERLVELDFGDWETLTWPEVHEQFEQTLRLWGEDWVNRSPPGGETFAQQANRCAAWLDEQHQSSVVVTHGGSIRALVCLCLGWPLRDAMRFRVDPASLTLLDYDEQQQRWCLRAFNAVHI